MHAFRAARAFDGGRALPGGALVLVEGATIAGVEAAEHPVPDGCPVTDLGDATLLPGLVDAHVHLCADATPGSIERLGEQDEDALEDAVRAALRQSLAGGVTAVRDLGDVGYLVADRFRGLRDAPTVVAAGPPVTTPGGHCAALGGAAAGPRQLRRAVREHAEHGVDVLKVMASGGLLTPGTDPNACQFEEAELRLLVEEAHAAGLPVTAHAHALAAVERAAAAGVDGIEHATCSTAEGFRLPAELAHRLAAEGTAVCPTLGQDPGGFVPPAVQARMDAAGMSWERLLGHAGALHRAGVRLVAGTDAGIGPTKPHGALREWVLDLVAAGAPAGVALAAATAGAAAACGLGRRTGRLAAGLDADLLAVAGDPLADPAALREVRLVVSRGRRVELRTP